MLFRGILLFALLVCAAVLVSRFRRRRWQFSLKWVLGVTLLLCLPLGWYAAQVRRVALEQEAIDHITDIGGFAGFDAQLGDDDRGFPRNLVPRAPRWLRELLGERLFSRVVQVRMPWDTVTDKDLVWLQRLDGTRYLNLTDAAVSDEGLRHLRGLTHLEELILENTHVSDAGLKHLSHLKALAVLNLRGTRISDKGLVHLKGLTNLYSLNVVDTAVSDSGLDDLQPSLSKAALRQQHAKLRIQGAGGSIDSEIPGRAVTSFSLGPDADKSQLPLLSVFPDIEEVRLSGSKMVDADLVHLTTLSKLKSLRIDCPGITGAGLHHLRSLKNLVFVNFESNSGLTDDGLKEVAGLKQVQKLILNAPAVTGTGLAHFRAMKNLDILSFSFAISEPGVEYLAQLDQLDELHFPAELLTNDQWKGLCKALPDCEIRRSGYSRVLLIQIVDESGRPVQGASVRRSAQREPGPALLSIFHRPQGISDVDGTISLPSRNFSDELEVLYALHSKRRLAAFQQISLVTLNEEVMITLQPACRVHGRLTSTELDALGHTLSRTYVDVYRDEARYLSFILGTHDFDFFLPPGEYRLEAYGSNVQRVKQECIIEPGQGEREVGPVDLPIKRR